MSIQDEELRRIAFALGLPPIPDGKRAEWVDGTLQLVDAPNLDQIGKIGKVDNRPITERVKTFEDACQILGENHPCVIAYTAFEKDVMAAVDPKEIADVVAFLKLRIIAAALNEGWEPTFAEDEYRWYPWFYLYTQEEIDDMTEERKEEISLLLWGGGAYNGSYCGLGCVSSNAAFSYSAAVYGSRLAVKSKELAQYFGRQFIAIWADYCFKPKATEE